LSTYLENWKAPTYLGRHSMRRYDDTTPGNFLSTPGLWIGLAFAVAFLAAAVRLRRYREPI
jgi:hypothetical protein